MVLTETHTKCVLETNALVPGFFLTDEQEACTARGQAIVQHTSAGRLGEAKDLIGTVLWLVSAASDFVTGTVIPVDGGFSAFSRV